MGVFAARRFRRGDPVLIPPLYIRLTLPHPLFNTVLEDYIHEAVQLKRHGSASRKRLRQLLLFFGFSDVINHKETPNVARKSFWIQDFGVFVYRALRVILPGEELFDNFGGQWIQDRGLTDRTKMNTSWFDPSWKHRGGPRCSKLAAGLGHESLQRALNFGVPLWRASVNFSDIGYGAATALVNLAKGAEIESAPALILPAGNLRRSALGPLVFEWDQLNTSQQMLLRTLRNQQRLKMLDTKSGLRMSSRTDVWEEHNVALLPLGGIPMVQRVGRESAQANCELWLRPNVNEDGWSASVEAVVVATRDVLRGTTLCLNLPPAGYVDEHLALLQELVDTGQPTPSTLQGVRSHPTGAPGQRQPRAGGTHVEAVTFDIR